MKPFPLSRLKCITNARHTNLFSYFTLLTHLYLLSAYIYDYSLLPIVAVVEASVLYSDGKFLRERFKKNFKKSNKC